MLSKQILKCLAVFVLIPWAAAGQNIAAKAVCTAAPAPNYAVTRGKNNAGSLVDGKYSKAGFMWLDPLTPGWQHVPKITLDLRMSNSYVVGRITLNTMTNASAGIGLPLNIHAFASEDGKNFQYLGDMMKGQKESGDQYRKVKCSLNGLAAQAKYLRLIVIPGGAFFFSDEIEVFPATGKGAEKRQLRIMNSAEIDAFLKGNEKASRNRKFLRVQISNELAHSDARQEKLLEELRSQIDRDVQLEEQDRYEFYLREIAQTRVKESFTSGKLVLKMLPAPWSADLEKAVRSRAGASAQLAVEIPGYRGGTEYLAFSVMNDDIRDMKATVNWDRSNSSEIRLYTAEQVKTRDFALVRDALFPIGNGQSLSFYPGEVKIIIAAVSPEKAGACRHSVRFKSKSGESAVALTMNVSDLWPQAQPEPSLNVNVWAYFNTPFLSKRGKSARSDLMEHYVNTIVIPPQFALQAIVCGDVQPLKGYLEHVRGFQKVLLFLNFRGYMTEEQNYFLSAQWKECFLAGYDEVLRLLEQKGVKSGNVYLYPFDEIRSNELDKYLEFASWIRSEREDVLLYATVSRKNIMARMNGYADICQLLDRKAVLADAGTYHDPQYWIYDIMDQSKSTSPYSKYRLMAWKAFSLDLQGVGFWAYGDIRGENAFTAWDDFDGNTADRAAVYERGDAIIPSRRWEAFKQGISDYDLLRMYARKFGEKDAKALCDLVLSKPQDAREAGRIREQILRKLAGN